MRQWGAGEEVALPPISHARAHRAANIPPPPSCPPPDRHAHEASSGGLLRLKESLLLLTLARAQRRPRRRVAHRALQRANVLQPLCACECVVCVCVRAVRVGGRGGSHRQRAAPPPPPPSPPSRDGSSLPLTPSESCSRYIKSFSTAPAKSEKSCPPPSLPCATAVSDCKRSSRVGCVQVGVGCGGGRARGCVRARRARANSHSHTHTHARAHTHLRADGVPPQLEQQRVDEGAHVELVVLQQNAGRKGGGGG